MAKQKQSVPQTYRIAHYIAERERPDGMSEYVVILEPGENPESEDYLYDGFSLNEVLEIEGDATSLPCNRALRG